MIRTLATLGLALLPASVAWWTGKRLLAHLDDAAFAERFLARRRYVGVTAVTCAVVGTISSSSVLLFGAVEAATLAAVTYHLRKAIYGEQWSFGAYLSWSARFALACLGFWIVVLVAPALLLRIPSVAARIAAGGVLAVGLCVWSRQFLPLARRLLRARPLEAADLTAAFDTIVGRSRVAGVTVDVIGPRGGIWPNALAVATGRKRHVFVGRTLLERLPADEVAAIFAHEVAHLEQFTPAFLQRLRLIDISLIVGGTLGVPLASMTGLISELPLGAVWCLGSLTMLIVRSHGHQRRESESDRRAAELCGDPDALVRALTKLHAIARIPRRWADEVERSATHPSLATRIRALRQTAGAPPAPAAEVFASRAGGDVLILDAARATWLKGLPNGFLGDVSGLQQSAASSQSVSYAALVGLHVEASPLRAPRLVARSADGQTYTFEIRPEDTLRVQRTLDLVEGHLAATRRPTAPREVAIVCALAAWILALLTSAWAVGILAIATLVKRTPATLLALAAALLATGILALRGAPLMIAPPVWIFVGSAMVAAAAAWAASQHRGADGDWSAGSGIAAAVAGSAAALAWAAGLYAWVANPSTLWIHRMAQSLPGATILPIAAATALLTRRDAGSQNAGRLLAILALVPLAIGSDAFLWAATRDPLLADAPELAWSEGDLTETGRVPLAGGDGYFDQLRLSSRGRRFAVRRIAEDDRLLSEFLIGEFNGSLRRTVHALDVRWIDDARLLLLTERHRSWSLEVLDVTGRSDRPEASWPDVDIGWPGQLEARSDGWMLTGWTASVGGRPRALRLRGRIGTDAIERTEWAVPADLATYSIIPAEGDSAIAVGSIYESGSLPMAGLLRIGGPFPSYASSAYRLTPAGPQELFRSALSFRCVRASASGSPRDEARCISTDGRRTFFWRMDLAQGSMTPEAQVDREILREAAGPDDGLVAWGACSGAAAAIWPSRREARAIGEPGRSWTDVATAGRQLAALEIGVHGQAVVRLKVP